MDPIPKSSQPDSGTQKTQSNPTQPNSQTQNIRPQIIPNTGTKPFDRNTQPVTNYQPQQPSQQFQPKPAPIQQPLQQQQQGYRPPPPGNYQQGQPIVGQPVVRPPVANPGPFYTNPDQQAPIRNIQPIPGQQPIRPPLNQPIFRAGPPPQLQQQFQRPNVPYQVPFDHPPNRMQAPPVALQRQPIPDQKIIRNVAPPPQNINMIEINRGRTFTANEGSMEDDDNDVVVGRMTTPQARPPVMQAPKQQAPPIQAPMMQRRESVQSIPSRPPSGMGSNHSQSPEPRMNPGGQFNARMDNRNISNEMSRQSSINNQDYMREPMDNYDRHESVQRPVNQASIGQQQRASQLSDEQIQKQNPRITRPTPPNIPPNDASMRSYQEVKQPEPFKQPNVQGNQPAPRMQQDSKQISDAAKPYDAKNRKNSVKLDLSHSENVRSAKDKSPSKGDNDSGVDENFQEKSGNSPNSPLKPSSKIPSYQQRPASITPKTRSRSTSKQRLSLKVSPESEQPEALIKKIPMNKIEVGNAPSPNLKKVQSKIGSLENATHKPGGGKIRIESRKLDFKATSRIEAKNDAYVPKGGEKKIVSQKLTWNAKSKIGSLENANHQPGGGDKRILEVKTDFKERAKPKVGSKDNIKFQPGGGDVKIVNQKIEVKGESKIGSLDNVGHKPGGGDKKIFDDKEYLKQIDHPIPISPQTQNELE